MHPAGTGGQRLRVSAFLNGKRIEGSIHVEGTQRRFSDLWESVLRDQRAFLAMTDATVRGDGPEEHLDFLLVDRADVRVIYPSEELPQQAGPARRMQLEPVRVQLLLEGFQVEGTIYFEPNKARFSEGWEALLRDRRPFIVVTDAVILSAEGVKLASPQFLAIEKDDIQAVAPCEDENASAPARRLPRIPVRAMMVLDGIRIEGTVHVEQGMARFSRFSDSWDALMRERRSFIAVTDACVVGQDGSRTSTTAPFMAIDKGEVRAVYPLE
jgi:hypothetical protein